MEELHANWVECDYQQLLGGQQSLRWIIDGNSNKSLEMRYSKADLVLYFIGITSDKNLRSIINDQSNYF